MVVVVYVFLLFLAYLR